MTYEKLLAILGVIVNGALYVGLLFAGGVLTQNQSVWKLAIITAGLGYLCYASQAMGAPDWVQRATMRLSVFTAVLCGILLLLNAGR